MEISKADWKLFRERVPEWQEHYMEQLVKKFIDLLSSPGNASDHFKDDYNIFLEKQNGFEVVSEDLTVKVFPLAHCGADVAYVVCE